MHKSKQQLPSISDMMMRESTNSQLHHDYTSSFQVQSQHDAPINYERILAAMTQARLARDHELDMMVQSLRSHRSANSDIADHSLRAEESRCFGQQDSRNKYENVVVNVVINMKIIIMHTTPKF